MLNTERMGIDNPSLVLLVSKMIGIVEGLFVHKRLCKHKVPSLLERVTLEGAIVIALIVQFLHINPFNRVF